MSEVVLVNVAGCDHPGITASLTGIMGRYGLNVLDIGQAVIHNNLSWGMLVEVPPEASGSAVFKELMFEAHRLGLVMQLTPVSESDYNKWVAEQGQSRHVITVLGKQIRAEHICRVTELITVNHLNIDRINRLSGRAMLSTPEHRRRSAIDFHVRGEVPELSVMHATFLQLSQRLDIDIAIQQDDVFRRNRRLVCFDMDSTLIQNEVIDELARVAGVGDEVSKITARAMAGEIDFKESFTKRLGLLKGLEEEKLLQVADSLTVTDGAERLIRTLKHFRFKVAIISGGFSWFAERLKDRLGVDYVYANELEIENGCLTGRVVGDIVDEYRKAELLSAIAEREDIRLEQVIAVGDGANDLRMLSIAGLGIAFRAKQVVRERAHFALGASSLDSILYLIGMSERDFSAIAEGAVNKLE
ncbi:MAG: phosphoserine phosphatase SerB [marine bacterium B5-7]|nr:MAG: phosphoserine phosphatase SerB [marine bacterium B5-7]